MLKWTLGHKMPTPGPLGPMQVPLHHEKDEAALHFARKRRSCGAVRKASVRALKKQYEEDKENVPIGVSVKTSGMMTSVTIRHSIG